MPIYKQFIFFLLVCSMSILSCKMDYVYKDNENIDNELSTIVNFYSCEEGATAKPVKISKRIRKGIPYKVSSLLSSAELAKLSIDGKLLGYKFYRMTDNGNTIRPTYVSADSDGYITSMFVSLEEMDIVLDWGVNYKINHYFQNTDGSTDKSKYTLYKIETKATHAGENSNVTLLTGDDIIGFSFDSANSDTLAQPVAADGSTVINLYYNRKTIHLTLNLNGGNIEGDTSNRTASGLYGTSTADAIAASLPGEPKLDGKFFGGWEPALPSKFPASDASYSAVWGSSLYTIKFDSNGGSGSMADLADCVYETEYTLPANTFTNTAADGTTLNFCGWNTNADGSGASYADGDSVSALSAVHNSTVTLYAQWEASSTTYTVNYKFEKKGSGGTSTYETKRTVTKSGIPGKDTEAEKLPDNDELLPGYRLNGSITQQKISADGTTVIDVNYKLKSITLTFNLNGGNIDGDTTKNKNVLETGYYNYTDMKALGVQGGTTIGADWQDKVENGGKPLLGWKDSITGKTIETSELFAGKFPTEDRTYTAQWGKIYVSLGVKENDENAIKYTNLTDAKAAIKDATSDLYIKLYSDVKYTELSDIIEVIQDDTSAQVNISVADGNTITLTSKPYFSKCTKLKTIKLRGFNLSSVKDLTMIFYGCTALESVDLSGFSTSSVTDIADMFSGCSSLTTISGLSNFDTSSVTDMSSMFSGCTSLEKLDLNSFNTSSVTNMANMFKGCSALKEVDLSSFNTSSVIKISSMFSGCTSLEKLDLSSFNTSKVTTMVTVFKDCKNLTTIYASDSFKTSVVKEGSYMFQNCTSLKGGADTKYSIANTGFAYAHIDGGTENPGYFTAKE